MKTPNTAWRIHANKEETQQKHRELRKALEKKDLHSVISVLSDTTHLRSFVIRRGEGGVYLKTLLGAFQFLLQETLGTAKLNQIEPNRLIEHLHTVGIPEKILSEILAVAYHLRKTEIFHELFTCIDDNQRMLHDPETFVYAYNIYGAWQGSVEKDSDKSLQINKQCLVFARKSDLEVLECKALFGLTDHKAYRLKKKLKPRKQIEDYLKLSQRFQELGVDYDAVRCDMEIAHSYLNLAKRQEKIIRKKEDLETGLYFAKSAQKKARDIGYPQAMIRAKSILQAIYHERGNERQSQRYANEAETIKRRYS